MPRAPLPCLRPKKGTFTFHRFPDFPADIRNQIWSLALPARTIESVIDFVDWKQVVETYVRYTVPPPVSRVCRESRAIASDYGFTNGKTSLSLILGNQCRPYTPVDTWLCSRGLPKEEQSSYSIPLDEFLKAISKRRVPISFSESLVPTRLSEDSLKKDFNLYYSLHPIFLGTAALAKAYRPTDNWTPCTITIHGSHLRVLKPGLFGDWGQTAVQVFTINEIGRLYDIRQMFGIDEKTHSTSPWGFFNLLLRKWFHKHLRAESPDNESFQDTPFDALAVKWFLSSAQSEWLDALQERFLAAHWIEAREEGQQDISDAWDPQVAPHEFPFPLDHRLIRRSQWVKKNIRKMPDIRFENLAVVVRVCHQGFCWEPLDGKKCGAATSHGDKRPTNTRPRPEI